MRLLCVVLLCLSIHAWGQAPSFIIGVKGDTLNMIDNKGLKQGKWVIHVDELRGEPGFEEEGIFINNRKEGPWRRYNLNGDLTGLENYRWGNKDGLCQYFSTSGALLKEERWRALNPDKQFDTLEIEDIDHLNEYKTVIVKNDGVAIRHGEWKFYDPSSGMIYKTENYVMGKLENPKTNTSDSTSLAIRKTLVKPKEVQDFEKKNAGKKKVKVRDGQVGY